MNRDQLAHVLRAATRITGDGDIVVLGSQSILGTYSDAELPDEVTMSVEADLAWRNDPDAAKADDVDGAIGEGSQFHSEWGYYAQGVEISTAVLPAGWEDRVEVFHRDDTEHTWARCLEPHDLCISKLVAGRLTRRRPACPRSQDTASPAGSNNLSVTSCAAPRREERGRGARLVGLRA